MLKSLGADLEEIVTMTSVILLAAEVGGSQRLSEAIGPLPRDAQSGANASTKAAMLARVCATLRGTDEPRASSAGH